MLSSCCFPLYLEPFCCGQFPVMYSFLLRVYGRRGACLRPLSCDEYIFLKKYPHNSRLCAFIGIFNFFVFVFFAVDAAHC